MGMSEASMAHEASSDWDTVRSFLIEHPGQVRDDAELLHALGLRIDAANVVEFGPAALARHAAARDREAAARMQMEQTARDNFAAQAQTHAAVVEILEARNNADLARRIDEVSRLRFGLVTGVIAAEEPEAVPAGWRTLPAGLTDGMFGADGLTFIGQSPYAEDLFAERAERVASCALVRLTLWSSERQGVLAFGSADPDAFTPEMGSELVNFLGRVVERTAERWPAL
jgi:uncharacterized protein YigA (DUF484 family)